MLHGEIKESMSANWEQVGLHKEVRTEKLDFVLIKPSNKTTVKNIHVRTTFSKRDRQTEAETFLNFGYNILAIYENEH